ncbi:MAG: AraC family transcriptional regulator [Peptostreptococcaceae bacterium]|nr:AraC family transcriptional regulator [Peptostreptococcaceae bacterium]
MQSYILPQKTKPDETELSSYLIESVRSFSDITQIPVTYLSPLGKVVQSFNADLKICNLFPVYDDIDGPCEANLMSACNFSKTLGEPYIFLCKSSLTNIIVPLLIQGECYGHFVAGPIIMGKLRESNFTKFVDLNSLTFKQLDVAKTFTKSMPTYSPGNLSKIAVMLFNAVTASLVTNSDYQQLKADCYNHVDINTGIKEAKKSKASYPYDMESDLINLTIKGNKEDATKVATELIKQLSIFESGDLQSVKSRLLWLFAIITSLSKDSTSELLDVLYTTTDIIGKLDKANNFIELQKNTIALINSITSALISKYYSGSSELIIKSIEYVTTNKSKKLSTNDTANLLHVNSSYLSTLFKKEMKVSFTDFVKAVKIEYACTLLINSTISINNIANECGYIDISYFTKVFKKVTGLTPKQYSNTFTK